MNQQTQSMKVNWLGWLGLEEPVGTYINDRMSQANRYKITILDAKAI